MDNICGLTIGTRTRSFASQCRITEIADGARRQMKPRTMRKVRFGGAPSLDGFFARKNDSVDWLMWSDEAAEVTADYWKTIDTLVMGRKTYEAGLKMTKGKKNPYTGTKTYVFSRTLKPGNRGGVEIVSADAVEFVSRLKQGTGQDIFVM